MLPLRNLFGAESNPTDGCDLTFGFSFKISSVPCVITKDFSYLVPT
jgi:hypothetical protein